MSDIKEPYFRPKALLDSKRILTTRLEKNGKKSAEKLEKKIESTAIFITMNPYAAALSRFQKLRKKRYRAFPVDSTYIMLYKVENEETVIYRIVDGRTNYADWVE